jgi:hypothetical protein
MAKRFTDTEKWKKGNFADLSLKMKLAWVYICDNCDHAGLWEVNLKLMSFQVGEEITLNELLNVFKGKIELVDDSKIFIQSFIGFQYGKLNPDSKVHKSVIEKLEKLQRVSGECSKGIHTLMVMDKDKAIDKAKEKETEELPSDILETIKINFGYPDDIIEEFRKEAWLAYQASPRHDKNWKRFAANFFNNHKEKIRKAIKDKASPPKTNLNGNQDAQAMSLKLFDGVIKVGSHGLKEYLASLNQTEKTAIEKFGRASEILSCSDFQSSEIKNRLKNACADALKENMPRAG